MEGLVYRAHDPQWSWKPLSGEGARRNGGRFNRPGVPALYLSFAPLTAIREAQPMGRQLQPVTLCAYRVDVQPVFDATDEEQLKAMKVKRSDLACPHWRMQMLAGSVPASQALADRLRGDDFVGMLVPSYLADAGDDDINLVLWKWGDVRPTRVELVDDEGRLRPPLS